MADTWRSDNGRPAAFLSQADIKVTEAPSPQSGNSSDTLQDNESFEEERKSLNISPRSTTTLNFDDLSIHDEDAALHPREHTNRSAGLFNKKVGQDHMPTAQFGYQVQPFSGNIHPFNRGHPFARGHGSNRITRFWVSEETRAAQEFLTVRNSMRRMFKHAEVAKWKVSDYIAHREAVVVSKAKQQKQQAHTQEAEFSLRVPPISPQKQDMMRRCGLSGNFEQVGNYSRALGEKTIWCEDWQNGKDEIAPWPCMAEMKWEGDDRAKTGVGRYPPLPREQGPVGLPWNQLQAVDQYPLDQIARIPTLEDVYLPVDEINDEVKYDLLNKALEDAMDAYLES